jgi:hypothetical protein
MVTDGWWSVAIFWTSKLTTSPRTSNVFAAARHICLLRCAVNFLVPNVKAAPNNVDRTLDANQARLAKSILWRLVEQALARWIKVIAVACLLWAYQIQVLQTIPGIR